MLTVVNGQFTQVQHSDHQFLHTYMWLAILEEKGAYKGEKYLCKNLIAKEGRGLHSKEAYFQGFVVYNL